MQTQINIYSLERAEEEFRDRVKRAPEDLAARAGLAWCLLLRSMHVAGRESALAACECLALTDMDAAELSARHPAASKSSRELLSDCLQNAVVVRHLNLNGPLAADAAKIHDLVHLIGASEEVTATEDEISNRLMALARDLSDFREAAIPMPAAPKLGPLH